jgi:GH15 family glucan-1,4-alpha-glucosidase
MTYQPIEDYGIIGNMRTAALVSRQGSIDWYCCPSFDSGSVFGALVDDRKGGRFEVRPRTQAISRQLYWPDTNVLTTRFLAEDAVGEVVDFMAVGMPQARARGYPLVRILRCNRGRISFDVRCEPAFNYARDPHRTTLMENGAVFDAPGISLVLRSQVPLARTERGVSCEVTLEEGDESAFVLATMPGAEEIGPCTRSAVTELLTGTLDFWRRWISRSRYNGRWREMVERSALVLKLLTYEPTGAIIASPTVGLPELVGGVRNWDYRYTWIRDAAFTLYGLLRIGFTEEAEAFMRWIEDRCHELEPNGELQIVYGIDGRHDLTEIELGHLEGYRGSRPVRIGNNAYRQLQLDIYGELMDSVYLYNKYGTPISYELWLDLRRLIDWVTKNWSRPDEGIWEVRGGREHFVYSKLMCWVAMDRAIRLADKRSFPADRHDWYRVRDEIYETIMKEGWSEKRGAFVQSFGSDRLDASNLIMPLCFFMAPRDPRMLRTIEAINRSTDKGGLVADSLVYRYNTKDWGDGVVGNEGTFNMCSFWLVEAMTRAAATAHELAAPRLLFERMLGYANHLGLYGEQLGPAGEALGNFPQGFTHLALISAAYNLDRQLGERRR